MSAAHRIEQPLTEDQMLLFLYVPKPRYALVCFASQQSVGLPGPFRSVALKDGAVSQRWRLDLKFVICYADKIDVAAFGVENFPSYSLFECGPSHRVIGRFDASGIDMVGLGELREFVFGTIHGQRLTGETAIRDASAERVTRETLNKWFAHVGKNSKGNLRLDDNGAICLNIGQQDILLNVLSGARRNSFQLLSFVGTECHGNEAPLLSHILGWNFSADHLHGAVIGVQRATSRFMLKLTFDLSELNEVTFGNLLQNFSKIGAECVQKIQEFRSAKTVDGKKLAGPSIDELREARASKFQDFGREVVFGKDALATPPADAYTQAEMNTAVVGFNKALCLTDHRKGGLRDQQRRHKDIISDLIQKDKEERRLNHGRLRPKLGVDGYLPHGTVCDDALD